MTLPDCMMPDGADPCAGYQALAARLAEAEALLREARGHLQYGSQPSDLFLRIDAFLGAKP